VKPCGRPLAEAAFSRRADDDADMRILGHVSCFLSG
jgi:hypothetical protein